MRQPKEDSASVPVEPERGASLLEELVAPRAAPPELAGRAPEIFVGECLDAQHPTLRGRVLVGWTDALGTARERWLPTLHGLAIRQTDRVLAQQPSNWAEPVVTGVVDGYAERPEIPRTSAGTIALKSDEAIRVTTVEGEPLLELRGSDQGPIVRLLREDVKIEAPGRLAIRAGSIELAATSGAVKISASDEVTVQGEIIRLN